MEATRRANRMGTASVVCLALCMLPPYENWKQPVNVVLLLAAFALAFRAGRSVPAWYAMCVGLVALIVALFYFALQAL